MSSNASLITTEHQPASEAGTIPSIYAAAPARATQPRDPVPALTKTFAEALPTALKAKARPAAIAAVRVTRAADAVKAARAVVQRIPIAAKLAIKAAVTERTTVRDHRARVRKEAVQDRYAILFADRIPALLKKREYESDRRCWDWMCEMAEQDEAEERAGREAAAA